jgi:hypothetical protein
LLLGALLSGCLGAGIGEYKGRQWWGFAAGLFLGPIGWIIMAVLEPTTEEQAARNVEIADMQRELAGRDGSETSADPVAHIERLHRLLTAGAITQEEYGAAKRKLLA